MLAKSDTYLSVWLDPPARTSFNSALNFECINEQIAIFFRGETAEIEHIASGR